MKILDRKQRAAFAVVVLLLRCVDGKGGGGGHGGGGHGGGAHGASGHGGIAGRAGIRGGLARALALGAIGIIGVGAVASYSDVGSKSFGGQAGGGSNDDIKQFESCFADADTGSDTYQNTDNEFDIY